MSWRRWRICVLWRCPWRIDRSSHEYWVRYQCGPCYALHYRMPEDDEKSAA